MKKFLFVSALSYGFSSKVYSQAQPESNQNFQINAVCILNPEKNQTARGIVRFSQDGYDSSCVISGEFTGLKTNAKHGFHIHELGDLTQGCTTAGPHYNPLGNTHGGPGDSIRHVGDLGNVVSDENGNATYNLTDRQISLVGQYSIVGRSCVLHENEDDLGLGNFPDSKTTGHSGGRIACGVIGLSAPKKV